MSQRVCLIGYGRVGRVTAGFLSERGVELLVLDSSSRNIEDARALGLDAKLVDASSPSMMREIANSCNVVATALPGRAAEKIIAGLIEAGAGRIVDVSYVADPMVFDGPARSKGTVVFVDAGVAPGLSNMLVAFSAAGMDRVDFAVIYVGGLSGRESSPLGVVASWNMEDMLEEYTRPARARLGGREARLDPIADATRVEVPGAGVFDALPTDGLRTLLRSLEAPTMIEYTLRYPGHVELLKALQSLGMLEDKPLVVEGCSIRPRGVLARLLEEKLPRSGDRLVLYTVVRGVKGEAGKTVEYVIDEAQEGLGLETPVLTYITGIVHGWFVLQALAGEGRAGVNPPESLASKLPELLELLRSRGIVVTRRVVYEESL